MLDEDSARPKKPRGKNDTDEFHAWTPFCHPISVKTSLGVG
jgi:hypothetical protein